jgi:hypothetical protein
MLPTVTEREAEFLFYMRMTIFCTSNHTGFITSDAPVVLLDPELHKMPPFYRNLAFGSPTIEVTVPIAPSRLVLFTHNEKLAEGYFPILSTLQLGMDLIDENNRRRRFHCDEHFVSNSSEKKEIWFDPGTPPPGIAK